MKKEFKSPKNVDVSNTSVRLKFKLDGSIATLIRIAFDIVTTSIGAATPVELAKAVQFENDKQKEAYLLVARSLIEAVRNQIKGRIDQTQIDLNGGLVYHSTELKFEIFKGLDNNGYTFNCNLLGNPQSFELLHDFKPYYKEWLVDAFPLSEQSAEFLSANFPNYFAYAFHRQLVESSENYHHLLSWCDNPGLDNWARTTARIHYQTELKAAFQRPTLGDEQVNLSDVYTPLDFKVYDELLEEEKRKKLRKNLERDTQDHFLPVKFEGSIHDYFIQHFIPQERSEVISCQAERSRMLILLGQPGHGKSSFCYRCIYDLLNSSTFGGNVFFVRLQKADRRMLDNPLDDIENMMPKEIDFLDWIDSKYRQKNVLFLDGLDEMYMTQCLTNAEVIRFIDNCSNLLERNTNLYIVITSRFNYVESSRLLQRDALVLSLGTLTREQQLNLINKYKERKPEEKVNLNPELLEQINKGEIYPNVTELIKLPILLYMILASGINLDKTGFRVDIYNQLFETVLERKWANRLRKYKKSEKFQPQHLRKYLSYLAFKIFQNQQGYLHKSQILEEQETKTFIRKYFKAELSKEEQLEDALKDVLTVFFFQERRKPQSDRNEQDRSHEFGIEFLHKSLYEYLACEYLWRSIKAFFLDVDEDGDYKNYEVKQVAAKTQEWFAHTRLTEETVGYLKEMINEDTKAHEELAKRMGYYLPKLLQYGFMREYRMPKLKSNHEPPFTVEQQNLHAFHAFLLVFGELNSCNIDEKCFFKSKWADLKHQSQSQYWLEAYHKFIDKLVKDINNNPFKRIDAESLVEEEKKFIKWFEGHKTSAAKEKTLNSRFEIWVRRFEFRKHGKDIKKFQIQALHEQKDQLLRLLKLSGVESLPMSINLSFSKWEKMVANHWLAPKIKMVGADLRHADFRHADLSHAYFRHADLSHAYLSHADLRNTNLSHADLRHADLRNAYLRNANLCNTYLRHADLRHADLQNADLRHADLRHADLRHAFLRNADLRNADLQNADLQNADLLDADLKNANLLNADLRNANIRESDLKACLGI